MEVDKNWPESWPENMQFKEGDVLEVKNIEGLEDGGYIFEKNGFVKRSVTKEVGVIDVRIGKDPKLIS